MEKGSLDFKPGPKKVVLKEDEQITANEEVNEDEEMSLMVMMMLPRFDVALLTFWRCCLPVCCCYCYC